MKQISCSCDLQAFHAENSPGQIVGMMIARHLGGGARRLTRGIYHRNLSSVGTLYTHRGIPSPDIVHMYLEEAGSTDIVTYENTNVNKMENRGEEYKKINPLGEVPTLVVADGGGCITESTTICKYLDAIRTDGVRSSHTSVMAPHRSSVP